MSTATKKKDILEFIEWTGELESYTVEGDKILFNTSDMPEAEMAFWPSKHGLFWAIEYGITISSDTLIDIVYDDLIPSRASIATVTLNIDGTETEYQFEKGSDMKERLEKSTKLKDADKEEETATTEQTEAIKLEAVEIEHCEYKWYRVEENELNDALLDIKCDDKLHEDFIKRLQELGAVFIEIKEEQIVEGYVHIVEFHAHYTHLDRCLEFLGSLTDAHYEISIPLSGVMSISIKADSEAEALLAAKEYYFGELASVDAFPDDAEFQIEADGDPEINN